MTELLYLDASALVKLARREAESSALAARIDGDIDVASSALSVVEVRRAVARSGGSTSEGSQSARVLERVALLRIDEPILETAAGLSPAELRSLDAIHLATALSLGTALSAFVVYDLQLGAAAGRAGLAVEAPGVR